MRRPNLPRTHSPCPSLHSASPPFVQHLWRARDIQQLAKAIPHRGIVHCRKRFGLRRRENPIVRPGSGAKEQEKPRTLQIAHCQDPAQKGGVFLVRAAKLSCDVVRMSKRSGQDADALLTRRQRLVAPPDHHWWTGSRPCLDNVLATNGEDTCTVPHLRLPLVDADPCVWSHKAVSTNLRRMAKRSGAGTMKMSSKKANNFSPGNNPLEIASRASC